MRLKKNQEAQLYRAMLHVIEYFANSLKVTQGHSKLHSRVGSVYKFLLVFRCMSLSRNVSEIRYIYDI